MSDIYLVDLRAILTRARSTRDRIVMRTYSGNIVCDEAAWEEAKSIYTYWHGEAPEWWLHGARGADAPDPDDEARVDALDAVIEALKPYEGKPWRRKTGL